MKFLILTTLIIQGLLVGAQRPSFLDANETVTDQAKDSRSGQRHYQDTGATPDNTYHAADCLPTGTQCDDREVCCSKVCKRAPGFGADNDVCCLAEGQICDSSPTGNPGLALCCQGTMCMPMMAKAGLGNTKIFACQVKPK